MESPNIRQETKKELTATYETLNPAELKRQIDKKLKLLNMTYDCKNCKKGRLKDIKGLNLGVIFQKQRDLISVS